MVANKRGKLPRLGVRYRASLRRQSSAGRRVMRELLRRSKSRVCRPMLQFATEEIVIPTGRYAGLRYSLERQPVFRHWFTAIDSDRWSTYAATGPSQSGKTLSCFVIPIVYHLFEVGEPVVVGLPDTDMAADKWENDIFPVIERTQYRELLARSGRGSGGGRFDAMRFRNGAVLKFMTAGGSDKRRAHFSTRVVAFTEVDGLDVTDSGSAEPTKVKQIEARTLGDADHRRIYKECTVSDEAGHIWTEYTNGTESRIYLQCPLCNRHVYPGRNECRGWKDSADVISAKEQTSYHCPSCDSPWDDGDRRVAHEGSRLVHRGQEIDDNGDVIGDAPRCDVFGFRWDAVNNFFVSPGFVGGMEWGSTKAIQQEESERELCLFFWAVPYTSADREETRIDYDKCRKRFGQWSQGLVPDGTTEFTVGVDVGKRLLHWVAVAWPEDGTAHVVDYGRIEVPSDDMLLELALRIALRDLYDRCEQGWITTAGESRQPDQVWIDAGWKTDSIVEFCREHPDFYRPILGRGIAQDRKVWYNKPTKTGKLVKYIGDGYHMSLDRFIGSYMVTINADQWKSRVHAMLLRTVGQRGAMTLFAGVGNTHTSFSKHMVAEHEIEDFIAGKGRVRRWVKVHSNNHWFDAMYIASASAAFAGNAIFKSGDDVSEEATDVTVPAGAPVVIRPLTKGKRLWHPPKARE